MKPPAGNGARDRMQLTISMRTNTCDFMRGSFGQSALKFKRSSMRLSDFCQDIFLNEVLYHLLRFALEKELQFFFIFT